MCTVSFVPKSSDYLLAMNRDERIGRGAGYPPEVHRLGFTRALFPSDNVRGTWVASNQYGITLALLNWNIPVVPRSPRRSRGLIIPHLLPSTRPAELKTALTMYELVHCAPFRLVAVIPGERTVLQWSWDGMHLARATCSWDVQHWFSSSASDNRAQELRGRVCSRASNDANAASVAWLRQLHRSHENGPGAFSLCVHRELVETLSYTEVVCTPDQVSMLHAIGSPCHPREIHVIEMQRQSSPLSKATSGEQQRIEETDVCRA
jgi:hypothetical protein